jgi:hypothetical protein
MNVTQLGMNDVHYFFFLFTFVCLLVSIWDIGRGLQEVLAQEFPAAWWRADHLRIKRSAWISLVYTYTHKKIKQQQK